MSLIFPPKHISLGRIAVFNGLSSQEMAKVEPLISPLGISSRCQIIMANEIGEFVYFILSGTVCIYRNQPCGTRMILNIVGAGEMLGEVCAIDNQAHSANAMATQPVALLRMHRIDFSALEDAIPRLSKNVKYLLAHRLRFATLHNEALAAREVNLRVTRLFCALADRYSESPQQKCVTIPLRLTQNEIAEWACVSRQHAAAHLARLRECGDIEMNRGYRLTILDRHRLSQRCD